MIHRLAALCAVAVGCGGIPGGMTAVKNTTPCSLSADGFVVGDIECSAELISYESVTGLSTFTLSGGAVGTTTATFSAGDVVWMGHPVPNTYSPPALVGAAASISQMVNGKAHAWIMRFQPSPPSNEPNTGSFQLNLTSTQTITTQSASSEYYAHGSVQVTLKDQDPMPEADVTLAGKF